MNGDSRHPEPADDATARIPLTPPPPQHIEPEPAAMQGAPMQDSPMQGAPSSGERVASGSEANGRKAAPPAPSSQAGERTPARPGPRTGPIVWGALILVFCGYMMQQVLGGGGLDPAGWITATIIGLGVLLLGVGFAVVIRGRRDTARRP
ncbi:hypothetical protein [Leucobacter sp. NPDC077196]|uniref:hypothetical protein n=1 Tax=Leucobacter sp. NPDC077196 TaxID=3154959 RepID=UPI00342A7E74